MILQCSDQYLHLNCRNIFLNLDRNVQRPILIFYHYEVHHTDVLYSCASTLLTNRFHVELMKEHPGKILYLNTNNTLKLMTCTSSSSSSLTRFKATISRVSRFLALNTVP